MAEIKTKIVITEKDILDLVCSKYNIEFSSATVKVSYSEGNQRGPSYTEIIIEGKPK